MGSLAPAAVAPSRPRRGPGALMTRLTPAEGWTAILLHLVLLLAAAWTVQRADWAPDRTLIGIATVGGFAAGLALAKLRVADLVAHLVIFWSGAGVAVWLASERLPADSGGRRQRLRLLWEHGLEWYRLTLAGRRVDDPDLFLILVGLTIWLVAAISAWVLYRRGWLTAAIVLPGLITVTNLGYAPAAGTAPLMIFLVAACLLAALHHAYRRSREWSRSRVPQPPRLPWRFLLAGANLALLAAILGWTLPLSARADLTAAAWERLDGPWLATVDRWGDRLADWTGAGRGGGGSYATFGESFTLGGALDLSDDPVVILRGDGAQSPRPTYLAGHRYDDYTGRGWSSAVEATFEERNSDGDRYASQMRFPPGQAVHLSPEVTGARARVTSRLTVLRPKGDLLFSTDTFLAADRRTNVQLSWQQLRGERYDLQAPTLANVPVDLRAFAALLRRATFPASTGGADSPPALDPDTRREIEEAQQSLRRRFLETAWTAGPDGQAQTLLVTGQIPVYDDVEAVFADEAVARDGAYEITALASTATAAELRAAGTSYPDWVRDRYLDLPETVTERTRALAAELAAGATNPFDVAQATQDHVRARIAYNEDINRPPRGQDVVDYVLFDSQEGYCEYYASAMAVMLRSQGIPARVVGGYFAVPYDPAVDGFLYREKQAHLWVEVYFPGYGWISFEPTASRETLAYGDLAAPTEPLPPSPLEPTPGALRANPGGHARRPGRAGDTRRLGRARAAGCHPGVGQPDWWRGGPARAVPAERALVLGIPRAQPGRGVLRAGVAGRALVGRAAQPNGDPDRVCRPGWPRRAGGAPPGAGSSPACTARSYSPVGHRRRGRCARRGRRGPICGGRCCGRGRAGAAPEREEGIMAESMRARAGGVLVAGAINTDLVARVATAPEAGETITGRSFAIFGGGKGANQAVAAVRSGAATAILGAVGDDDFGRTRLADLDAEGIDRASVAVTAEAASGVALIVVEEASGQNRIAYVPGATLTVTAEAAREAVRRLRPAVLLATLELPDAAKTALFAAAREAGATVLLNATPEAASGRALVPSCDVLIVNESEAADLLGRPVAAAEGEEAARALTGLGPRTVVITLGAAGAVIAHDGETVAIPAPAVEVQDTTGAGDAFCGAMAARLASGADPVAAAGAGVIAGSLAATRPGAQPSMPTRDEIERLAASQSRPA